MLSVCLQRACGHLLSENICLNLSNTYFNKEIVDHLVAVVQDCANTSRSELFHSWSFLAMGIRLNVYLIQSLFLKIFFWVFCVRVGFLFLKRIYGTKPFRWISLFPFYTFVAVLNGTCILPAITFQVISKLTNTFSVFCHAAYASLSNTTQSPHGLPCILQNNPCKQKQLYGGSSPAR